MVIYILPYIMTGLCDDSWLSLCATISCVIVLMAHHNWSDIIYATMQCSTLETFRFRLNTNWLITSLIFGPCREIDFFLLLSEVLEGSKIF